MQRVPEAELSRCQLHEETEVGIMILKPGMRVKVEIEAEVEASPTGMASTLRIAGMAFNPDGTRHFDYPGTVKVTPLSTTQEVTVRLTGPGLTSEQAEKLVRHYLEQPYSISGASEIQFDVNRPKGDR